MEVQKIEWEDDRCLSGLRKAAFEVKQRHSRRIVLPQVLLRTELLCERGHSQCWGGQEVTETETPCITTTEWEQSAKSAEPGSVPRRASTDCKSSQGLNAASYREESG